MIRKMKSPAILMVVTGVFVALVLSCGAPVRADDAAAEALYKTKCNACHGADGKGDTPAGKKMGVHDLSSSEVQKISDADLSAAIADGKNKMPGYKKSLSAEQIKGLVAYIRSMGKK
jgi:mono/diheme cytochrome c family protein